LCLVFSANPEDYTNRGRLVTPLKDRIGSVIRTHYPLTRELGIAITEENAWTERTPESDGEQHVEVVVPRFMKEIVEEISRLARTSPHVNQASGVSVRMSIANYENMISNAERRAVMLDEESTVTRISDLAYLAASARGKMELNMTEETGEEDRVCERLTGEAVKNLFDQHFNTKLFRNVVDFFENGHTLEVGDKLSATELLSRVEAIKGFSRQIAEAASELEPDLSRGPFAPGLQAAVAEFLLEGLHCNNRLNKKPVGGGMRYGL
jgi:magnesium chelatase subunit I